MNLSCNGSHFSRNMDQIRAGAPRPCLSCYGIFPKYNKTHPNYTKTQLKPKLFRKYYEVKNIKLWCVHKLLLALEILNVLQYSWACCRDYYKICSDFLYFCLLLNLYYINLKISSYLINKTTFSKFIEFHRVNFIGSIFFGNSTKWIKLLIL